MANPVHNQAIHGKHNYTEQTNQKATQKPVGEIKKGKAPAIKTQRMYKIFACPPDKRRGGRQERARAPTYFNWTLCIFGYFAETRTQNAPMRRGRCI